MFRGLVLASLRRDRGVSRAEIEARDFAPEIPLRQRNQRQANALLALITDRSISSELRELAILRLGRCADKDSPTQPIAVLSEIAGGSDAIASAAKIAIREIERAAPENRRVFMLGFECEPYAGTGGLGGVTGELAEAMAKRGATVHVTIPGHGKIDREKWGFVKDPELEGIAPGRNGTPRWEASSIERNGVHVHLIDDADEKMFRNRKEPYGNYPDNPERYDFFAWAAKDSARAVYPDSPPDMFIVHDNHAAMAAYYAKQDPSLRRSLILGVVHHNDWRYQGRESKEAVFATRLPEDVMDLGGKAEFHGKFCRQKLLLGHDTDGTIVVSTFYKNEMMTHVGGNGMEGVALEKNAHGRLFGIANGVDTRVWTTENNPNLEANWAKTDVDGGLRGREINKRALQLEWDLEPDPGALVHAVVSRLDDVKGWDRVVEIIEHAMKKGDRSQFVLLGWGHHPQWSPQLEELASRFPGKVSLKTRFTPPIEHRLYGGAERMMQLSYVEPCGTTQLKAAEMGCNPIVTDVGGCAETVVDLDGNTGFGFRQRVGESPIQLYDRSYAAAADPEARRTLAENISKVDFSWDGAAAPEYFAVWRELDAMRSLDTTIAVAEARLLAKGARR
jgi:starch synthase